MEFYEMFKNNPKDLFFKVRDEEYTEVVLF